MRLRNYASLAFLLLLLTFPSAQAANDAVEPTWPSVELYTTDWCPYCIKAKAFFDRRKIPYKLYDVEKSREAAFRKKTLAPGAGVPVVVIDGTVIRGYSEKAFRIALELDE